MEIKFNTLNDYEEPQLILCNPNNKKLGVIIPSEFSFNPKFNEISTISLSFNQLENQELFEKIEKKRQILVEDIGYFIIDDVKYSVSDKNEITKDVTASSCEIELTYNNITYFDGTYKFYDEDEPSGTLLGKIMSNLPKWYLEYVDENVVNKYRTFDVPNDSVYSFLMGEVSETYECIFEYDILNRKISVYDKNNYVKTTSVIITQDETLEDIDIDNSSEDIITALKVYGQEDLSIHSVNPIGSSVIYNFDYFNNDDWFSNELQVAMNDWLDKIEDSKTSYVTINNSLKTKYAELLTLQTALDGLKSDLKVYEQEKSVYISENDQAMNEEVTALINTCKSAINTKQTAINSKQAEIDVLEEDKEEIIVANSFKTNFTENEYNELSSYIYESSYTDEHITVTDSMTYSDIQGQAQQLYDIAKNVLDKNAKPVYDFSIKTTDFIFQKSFEYYTDQLETGSLIYLEKPNGVYENIILLGMDIDFINKSCSFELSNTYRQNDAMSLYADLYASTSRSSNTVVFEKSIWGKPVKSGQLQGVVDFTKTSLDLTNNAIQSSTGQDMIIDDTGLKGLKKDVNGDISPEQLRLVNNALAFSDDSFDTIKTAIGKIYLPEGQEIDGKNYVFGVSAEYLAGNMIVGNGLTISTNNGSLIINDDGFYSEQVENNTSNINQMPNQILNEISEEYVNNEKLIRSESTILEQTNESITATKTTLQTNINTVSNGLDEANENIGILKETVQIDGSVITIGRSDSNIQVRIDNDSFDIIDNGVVKNFFGNEEVKMGNFKWQPRNNGNLSLVHI